MKRLSILFLFVFGLSDVLWAQDEVQITPKFRPSYFCEINTGFMTVHDLKGFAHVKNGISLTQNIDLSLGLGLEGHTTGRYLPIFLESRYNFLKGKTRPFVAVSGGFLQVIQDWGYANYSYDSRKHFGVSGGSKIGIQHQFISGLAIVSTLGYRYTFAQYERDSHGWWHNLPVEPTIMMHNMHRFELSIGLLFK